MALQKLFQFKARNYPQSANSEKSHTKMIFKYTLVDTKSKCEINLIDTPGLGNQLNKNFKQFV